MRCEVADECNSVMHALAQKFPEGLTYSIPYDTTRFVKVSIREVVKTLAEAMALVFVVVFVFLQNWRATLIPFAAVPVSLIGTFAGLYLMGYSINTLTLFGMVLSIGIVVDDAIVVLENIERIMHEEHKQPREAAIQAMNEVTGPVVAIVLTLCAVFVPIAFLGGLTGELYRQFSVTISIAVIISGIVALTLTPSLCVLILKRRHRPPGRFFRWFNDWFHARHHTLCQRRRLDAPARGHRADPVRRAWSPSPPGCGATRPAAWCPTRTRATTSARCSCRMAPRCSAPTKWCSG